MELFDFITVTPVIDFTDRVQGQWLRRWFKQGFAGQMHWFERNLRQRLNIKLRYPWAQSVLIAGLYYYNELAQPRPLASNQGRISKHALVGDYHPVVKERLNQLVIELELNQGPNQGKIFVDSSPVLEKAYAAVSGVGFIGKNSLFITPQWGSFIFLGGVVSNLMVSKLKTVVTNSKFKTCLMNKDSNTKIQGCGDCTRCVQACPTGALIAPYQLDARRCIAYLTIEHRGKIPAKLGALIGDWQYGCDVCQLVCPYNARLKPLNQAELSKRFGEIKVGILTGRYRSG